MRVFVTGGGGFIGSAVVRAFLEAGHEVTAMTRSKRKARGLELLGAAPHLAALADPPTYLEAAAGHDAAIHVAFDTSEDGVELDALAIRTLVQAARGGGVRQVIYTSGCWVLGETGPEPVDESAATGSPAPLVAWRPSHEQAVLSSARPGLTTAVVRPGMVYGGTGSLTAALFRTAERDGATRVIGDGRNHWAMVHREDLGRLYLRVAETGAGGVVHGVDGHPVRALDVARAASEAAGAGGAVSHVPVEEARAKLGAVADALCLDQRLATSRAAELGWAPECPSFLECASRAFREWSRSV